MSTLYLLKYIAELQGKGGAIDKQVNQRNGLIPGADFTKGLRLG